MIDYFWKFLYSFFLDSDSVGSYRGEVALQMLLELNPDVRGAFVDQPVKEILDNQPDYFNSFTTVIATGLSERWLILMATKYILVDFLSLMKKQADTENREKTVL